MLTNGSFVYHCFVAVKMGKGVLFLQGGITEGEKTSGVTLHLFF